MTGYRRGVQLNRAVHGDKSDGWRSRGSDRDSRRHDGRNQPLELTYLTCRHCFTLHTVLRPEPRLVCSIGEGSAKLSPRARKKRTCAAVVSARRFRSSSTCLSCCCLLRVAARSRRLPLPQQPPRGTRTRRGSYPFSGGLPTPP